MSRVGRHPDCCRYKRRHAQGGFTSIELLAVIAILAMVLATTVVLTQPSTARTELKAATARIASILRNTRTNAILQRSDRAVLVDVSRRLVWSRANKPATAISKKIRLAVTSAQSQNRRNGVAGIKFYPNGSSSGATIRLYGSGQINEIRVNWLTGRVSQRILSAR